MFEFKGWTHEKEMGELYGELVPDFGIAETMAGEIVRAVCRLGYRFINDGDMIGVGPGNETCNAPARFLRENMNVPIKATIQALWCCDGDEEAYAEFMDMLITKVYRYVIDNPGLREIELPYGGFDNLKYHWISDDAWGETEEEDEGW